VKRLAVLAVRSADEADGVRDYSSQLVDRLREQPSWNTQLNLCDRGSWRTAWSGTANGWSPSEADVVLLQYSPFWYGRRSFSPGLPIAIWRLRASRRRPAIALMVHETFMDASNWRWALMGAWQRVQLFALQAAADIQFHSTEAWMTRARQRWPAPPARHLPVASNFPDRRADRDRERRALGLEDGELVLACFRMDQRSGFQPSIMAAAEAVAAAGHRVRLINFGGGTPTSDAHDGITVLNPGYLEPDRLAALLSTADIFLAPHLDGVSTRRTTVMSALQHEVAVVGTDGHYTDGLLREASSAIRLVPLDRPDLFAGAARELADDAAARVALAKAGRALYEKHFDWPVITASLVDALESLPGVNGGGS
jgi:glycosyltransferase involved in cell wall biosynthesis